MMVKRILVYGAGSLGLTWAALLADSGLEIKLYARPRSALSINLSGIKLSGALSLQARVEAVDTLPELSSNDIILICVKSYDLRTVLDQFQTEYPTLPILALLQNGFFISDHVTDLLPCSYHPVDTTRIVTSPGAQCKQLNRAHIAGLGQTFIEDTQAGSVLADGLKRHNLPVDIVRDISPHEINKAIANSIINPLTAINGYSNGQLLADQNVLSQGKQLLAEISQVLASEGHKVAIDEQFDNIIDILKNTSDNTSSMLQDVWAQKPTEIDFLLGTILEIAGRHALKTPVCQNIYDQISISH